MRQVRGSATVETALMMPVVFFTFVLSLYMMFYFHDKNILIGAAYETAVVGAQKLRWDVEDAEEQMATLFQERIRGKLIFFGSASSEISIQKERIEIQATAEKKRMRIHVTQQVEQVCPEKKIRDKRKMYGGKI